jgi:hypothetical protein
VTDAVDRGSPAWRVTWRAAYALIRLLDPLVRSYRELGLPGLDPIVELRIRGRRTGRDRGVLVTLLPLDGRVYVGHPNGSASWIRNLEATGEATILIRGEPPARVRATALPAGDERTAVIRATARLQPFPANLLYRAARGHILRVGRYVRLESTRD